MPIFFINSFRFYYFKLLMESGRFFLVRDTDEYFLCYISLILFDLTCYFFNFYYVFNEVLLPLYSVIKLDLNISKLFACLRVYEIAFFVDFGLSK